MALGIFKIRSPIHAIYIYIYIYSIYLTGAIGLRGQLWGTTIITQSPAQSFFPASMVAETDPYILLYTPFNYKLSADLCRILNDVFSRECRRPCAAWTSMGSNRQASSTLNPRDLHSLASTCPVARATLLERVLNPKP